MLAHSLLHKIVSFFVVMGLLLTPLSPTPVQAAAPAEAPAPQVSDTPVLPAVNRVDSPISVNAPDVPNLPAKGEALQPVNPIAQALRDGTWPAQLVGSTGNIQSSRNGPQRNDPSEGIPTHAYSPFDERNNREHPCPPGGCEFETDVVLVKLAPTVTASKTGPKGAWTDNSALNQALAVQGFTQMEPLFPTAVRPAAGLSVQRADGSLTEVPDLTRWYRVRLGTMAAQSDSSAQNVVLDAVQQLAETPGIDYAEPDYLRKPVGEPTELTTIPSGVAAAEAQTAGFNDPLYSQQWHLGATNVPQAWTWLTSQGLPAGGSRDIVVAVIDTGVDYTHPDLAANMWVNPAELAGTPGVDDDGNGFVDDIHGANVVSNQHSGDPQDDHGHGTHVAGIIAAQADNGIGGVGVAYNVQVMAIKAAQYSGVLSASDIAQGIYYAVQQGADVINMSFGGYARSQLEEDALVTAFGQAVLVAAAGNDGVVNLPCPFGRDMYPAAYNWVLGVMASKQVSDSIGWRAFFSNYDCALHDSHEYELMAPGVDVWSTLPNGQYAAWDGTSMAAPVVSGIAALLRTKWVDKDVFSSRFIMGQIASNALPTANAFSALTVAPKPELRYLEHWLFDTTAQNPIDDNDGIVDAGETIDLAIILRNHWGKADNVSVKLEAWAEGAFQADPYVTMITGTVDYGVIGSFNWDDNGIIYDEQGVITGVRTPFRFSVNSNTPNDHIIPLRLTMTAKNGYSLAEPALTFVSRFYLIVQRGRELPRFISQDMSLTKDDLWLLSDATLIEAGVTVTVTEGAQVQFWSADPADPYSQLANAFLQVEGNLEVQGTVDEPVELFSGAQYPGYAVEIRPVNSGHVELHYARIVNPISGTSIDGGMALDLVDHSYVSQSNRTILRRFDSGDYSWRAALQANTISNSIFRGLGEYDAGDHSMQISDRLRGNLYDSNTIDLRTADAQFNVFLKNYQLDGSKYWVSTARNVGFSCQGCEENIGRANNQFRNNAILNTLWDPDTAHWMQFYQEDVREIQRYVNDNYWGTTSTSLIDKMIRDYNDGLFNRGSYIYQPILTTIPTTAYPFVMDVVLSMNGKPDISALNGPTPVAEAGPVTFTISFNRDMDISVQPSVSFGPDAPETDYTIHPVDSGWQGARTWKGTFEITPITGDGYQLMRIAGPARAADDSWLVIGDDTGRFRFKVDTQGIHSRNLHAVGGEGFVDLAWTQNDFELLAGFNLYRSTTLDGTYTRLNSSIIPPSQRALRDTDVTPGQPYYYKFTIVKSDMGESDFSNIATATPLDTILPMISHTPLTSAAPGLPVSLFADVTDNVAVKSVTLFHRRSGTSTYSSRAMVKTTGDRYTATLEGTLLISPGVDYYIQASDGVNIVSNGRAELPNTIVVDDRPTVTNVTPNKGSAAGGTVVTIVGSNFKAGASVTFGGAVAEKVQIQSSSRISATTPAHFPAKVDVQVANSDGQQGSLLQAFTYESDAISVAVANGNGGQGGSAELAISAANVKGLVAADLTLSFGSTILRGVSARTGNLTPGWALTTNTATPGQVRLSFVSTGGAVTGSGVLAYVTFDVLGAPGTSTALQLSALSFNDGAIPTQTTNGTFNVDNVYDVAGTISFWNGGVVSNTLLAMQGDRLFNGTSQSDGTYTVRGAPAGNYTLTPNKSDNVNGISAYDASLALQHAVGTALLTGPAAIAGDVNQSGQINSMDAYYILQKAVDLIALPFPGAGKVWTFSPTTRSITGLSSHRTGEDFTAILIGDVSGNWNAPSLVRSGVFSATETGLQLRVGGVRADNVIPVTVQVNPGTASVQSLDLRLTYDPAQVAWDAVELGDVGDGWMVAQNGATPGKLSVALAGATPITEAGVLLTLRFHALTQNQRTGLTVDQARINEAPVPVELLGSGEMGKLYLPILLR